MHQSAGHDEWTQIFCVYLTEYIRGSNVSCRMCSWSSGQSRPRWTATFYGCDSVRGQFALISLSMYSALEVASVTYDTENLLYYCCCYLLYCLWRNYLRKLWIFVMTEWLSWCELSFFYCQFVDIVCRHITHWRVINFLRTYNFGTACHCHCNRSPRMHHSSTVWKPSTV